MARFACAALTARLPARIFALTFAFSPAFAGADPVDGMWQTEPDDGAYAHVQMAACSGVKVCGWIRRTFNANGAYQGANIGNRLVINMETQGDGTCKGAVRRSSNAKTHIGKMALDGDRLELAGCVVGGLLCSSQTWVRVPWSRRRSRSEERTGPRGCRAGPSDARPPARRRRPPKAALPGHSVSTGRSRWLAATPGATPLRASSRGNSR